MTKNINKTTDKESAQTKYDDCHDEINTVYSIVKEGINTDKRIELGTLKEEKRVNPSLDYDKEKV